MHSGSFGHLRLKMQASNTDFLFLLTMLLKKIYLSNKAHSTIQHMFTKEKKIPGQKVGGGGAGAPLANP